MTCPEAREDTRVKELSGSWGLEIGVPSGKGPGRLGPTVVRMEYMSSEYVRDKREDPQRTR